MSGLVVNLAPAPGPLAGMAAGGVVAPWCTVWLPRRGRVGFGSDITDRGSVAGSSKGRPSRRAAGERRANRPCPNRRGDPQRPPP